MMQVTRRIGAALAVGIGAIALFAIAKGQGQDLNAECVSNVRQLECGLHMYVDDWDGVFPTMKTPAQFQAAVTPFVSSSALFTCPVTGFPYKPDAALSGASIYAAGDYGYSTHVVGDFGSTVGLRDAVPHPDGKSSVAYLDAHVTYGGVDQEDPNQACVNNARKLTTGLMMYVQDYDEYLPPVMDDPKRFEQELYPYLRNHRLFHCPAIHQPYKPNTSLAGLSLAEIPDLATTMALQDAHPHPDGLSTVTFLDMRVERGGVVQPEFSPDIECNYRISQLMTAIAEYAQDYDEKLPPMQNISVFQQAVSPYTRTDVVFDCPYSGLPYRPNAKLSGVSLNSIPDLSKVAILRDPKPHADEKIAVGYLDGYIERGGVDQADPNQECAGHMRELLVALQQYTQDNNGTLPPMKTYTQFKQAVFPYVRSSRTFLCPYWRLPYKINHTLSGQPIADFASPSTTVVLQDPYPHKDGRRTIGYLDGHVEPERFYDTGCGW